jgi:uncharacterized protein (TIGR03437 family)
LINDDAVTWLGPIAPGAGSLTNGACTLNGVGLAASGSGTDLTVNYAVTFQPYYVGRRGIYLSAKDQQAMTLDWSAYGAWWPTITAGSLTNWYRLYDPFTSSHHFTTDTTEYTTLITRGFSGEGAVGQAYNAPNGSATAYYRIYIIPARTHFWTTDRNEYLTLILNRGYYSGEGIDPFLLPSAAGGAIPYYRLLYCCASPPVHHWTTDANEYTTLQQRGWSSEGISGYLMPVSTEMAAENPVMSVVNAGSYERGAISGGQAIHIYGHDMVGAHVSIDGRAVQVVSAGYATAQVVVPEEVSGPGRATVRVEHVNGAAESGEVEVAAASPSVYATDEYGKGQAQARLANGRMNSEQNGVAPGEEVVIYATGLGAGLPISVTVGGHPAELLGVIKIDGRAELRIRVPDGLEPSTAVAVTVRAGEYASQGGVTLFVR